MSLIQPTGSRIINVGRKTIRPLVILLAFSMAFLAACTTPTKRQKTIDESPRKHALRLTVFNQADIPIAFTVFVDGQAVLDSTAPINDMRPAFVLAKELDVSPGHHTIVALDRTRNFRKQVALVLKEFANLDLYLNAKDIELGVDYDKTKIYF